MFRLHALILWAVAKIKKARLLALDTDKQNRLILLQPFWMNLAIRWSYGGGAWVQQQLCFTEKQK